MLTYLGSEGNILKLKVLVFLLVLTVAAQQWCRIGHRN